MKNKHLILLFLSVLLLGYLLRRIPFRYHSFFRVELIQVDTTALDHVLIRIPGQPELSIERTGQGWSADQDGRSSPVAESDIRPLLQWVSGVFTLRTVKTTAPDTLGFNEKKRISVRLFQGKRLLENFDLGSETLESEDAATFLSLPLHDGIYVVPGHLRAMFSRSVNDYRGKNVVDFEPGAIYRLALQDPDAQPVFFEKNDSLSSWITPDLRYSIKQDEVDVWLKLFSKLNDLPFADHFDESTASRNRLKTIRLEKQDGSAQLLDFYYLKPPEAPEDIRNLRAQHLRDLPVYVVHSSSNSLNYFSVTDSNLVKFLCFGLWKQPENEPDR